jgi:hypothetical protein
LTVEKLSAAEKPKEFKTTAATTAIAIIAAVPDMNAFM